MRMSATALTLVAVALLGLAFVAGCGKAPGAGGVAPEKTHSLKCSNADCNWADAELPETQYKGLKKDESGKLMCPMCQKTTLAEGGK